MPAKTTIVPTVESIDPTLARNWLKNYNTRNRRLRPRRVQELTDIILRGEWQLDGSAIRFSDTKKLLDGQHRLAAIDKSGRTVQCLVVRGLKEESQEVMDRTLSRSYADKLHIDEEANATTLASAAHLLWRYENLAFGKDKFSKKPSFPQLDDVINRHPELRRAVTAAGNLAKKIRMSRAYIAAARTIFIELDPKDADGFFSDLATGADLQPIDPAYRLREALTQNALSSSKKYSSDHLLALTFKAWNLYRKGEPCRNLSFRAGGASPEAFPMPI